MYIERNGSPQKHTGRYFSNFDPEDESDLEDVLSESNDDYIPQGDASESEDNVELNSEESDIASAEESVDGSDEEEELIAESGRVWKSTVPPVIRRRRCTYVIGSPGPTHVTDNTTTMQEVFNLFFDDEIVQATCTYTNLKATRVI